MRTDTVTHTCDTVTYNNVSHHLTGYSDGDELFRIETSGMNLDDYDGEVEIREDYVTLTADDVIEVDQLVEIWESDDGDEQRHTAHEIEDIR